MELPTTVSQVAHRSAGDHIARASTTAALGSVGGTAGLAAIITSGRFTGDQIIVANLRGPSPCSPVLPPA